MVSMAYRHYNNNPLGKSVGDCVIRAVSAVIGKGWDETFMDISAQAFRMADITASDSVWSAYLKGAGYKRRTIPDTCPDCYTIADFAADHPSGRYVVGTGTHAVAVIDGDVFDSWDSTGEIPTFYFERAE